MDTVILVAFVAVLLFVAALTGVLAGLLGVGGGIVIVPMLFILLPAIFPIPEAVAMQVAVGTSLATIIFTSLNSARTHHKHDAVDTALLRNWGIPVFVGACAGAALAGPLQGNALMLIFATVALLVSINMFIGSKPWVIADALPGRGITAAIGGAVGTVSTLMGIGGGTLSVPILSLFSYPIRRAVGTAAALGVIISIPGTIGFMVAGWDAAGRPPYSLGYVNLAAFAVIVPLTVYFAPVGARLAHEISAQRLRRVFALFLVVTSVRMYLGVIN